MADFEEVTCPFCNEAEFDLFGLKLHLINGWCDVFEALDRPKPTEIPTLAEVRELLAGEKPAEPSGAQRPG